MEKPAEEVTAKVLVVAEAPEIVRIWSAPWSMVTTLRLFPTAPGVFVANLYDGTVSFCR